MILLAAALRLPGLASRPMHADEAVHADKFGTLLEGGGYAYDPAEYHGPTLYYMTLPSAWLQGATRYVAIDEVTLRVVPAVLGVALVAAHLGAGAFLGWAGAAVAALLVAISPAMVFYSRYYIHETPLVLFSFGALLGACGYLRKPGVGPALLTGACGGLMHATKETAPLALGCMLLALVLTRLVDRRRGQAVPEVTSLVRGRDGLLALLAAILVSSLLFSSFLSHPRGIVDSVRAYAIYLDRAGAASWHFHPWDYYLRLLIHFPAEGTPLWTEGLIVVLAVFGGAAGWSKRGVPGADSRVLRFLGFYTLLMLVVYSAIPYKTPWCLLGFLHGMILLAGTGAVFLVRASRGVAIDGPGERAPGHGRGAPGLAGLLRELPFRGRSPESVRLCPHRDRRVRDRRALEGPGPGSPGRPVHAGPGHQPREPLAPALVPARVLPGGLVERGLGNGPERSGHRRDSGHGGGAGEQALRSATPWRAGALHEPLRAAGRAAPRGRAARLRGPDPVGRLPSARSRFAPARGAKLRSGGFLVARLLGMTADADGGARVGLGEAIPGGGAHRFSHAAMATVFEVHCVHADARYAAQAAQAAFDLVDRLEQDLSRFVENSDISRINHLAAGQGTGVSPRTMECLEIAWHVYGLTGGAFDASIGSGLQRLELHPDEFTVHARDEGARLDLGGIGKGYAVDRMAEVLEEWEIPHALVHGGYSSVLALEAPPEQDGWPLTLSAPGPGDNRVLARVSVRHRAFSASGVRKGDHILDPRTGLAVHGRAAAWVAVPREDEGAAAVADALSTAFMIQPAGEIAELCRRFPGLEVWIVPEPPQGGEKPGVLVHLGASTT